MGYAILLWAYGRAWNNSNQTVVGPEPESRFISIVIVSRNEGGRLLRCVESIVNGTYPTEQYEIIIVDDHSTDHSMDEVSLQFQDYITILHLGQMPGLAEGNYKKQGQSYGISQAQGDWIVTTDGDCICPPAWLKQMNQYFNRYDIVTGPIQMIGEKSALVQFQVLDILGTMGGTHYGIHKRFWYSANAANMGFSKELFHKYNRQQQTEYASGDDMFFIQWAAAQNTSIGFLHESTGIVKTEAETTFSDFWSQRIRWASKTKGYKDWGLQLLMSIVWVYCSTAFINLILGIFINPYYLFLFMIMILAKGIADYGLFFNMRKYFNSQIPFIQTLGLSFFHMMYVTIIGIWSQVQAKYLWKGRIEN